jgi:hypothetical protein
MGRERCLFCGRFIFDGDDTSRPSTLGVAVHRHCYLRDAGLESSAEAWNGAERDDDDDEAEDSAKW